MANNNFKPFAAAAGANVMTQADYEALAALLTGFVSGTAQSAQLNKVWRQSSIMSAVLAQFIVDLTGQDAIDDGTTATLLANLKSAVRAQSVAMVGAATNLKCVTTVTGTSLPYSADQIAVGGALSGPVFLISNFNVSISALDTGSLAANSYYAAYAYLKSDGTKGGFLQLEPAGGAPATYGGANPPAGMIASALIGVWPTNGSAQFIVGSQFGRQFNFVSTGVLTINSVSATPTSFSLAAAVPKSAKYGIGSLSITSAAAGIVSMTIFQQSASGASSIFVSNNNQGSQGGNSNQFPPFPIITPQTWYWVSSATGTTISNGNLSISGYIF
ncbi:hypothetical protein [Burkholderia ubonensis]|uniref:hypothetical protein n=1 Tax=Burkholderia ubonensis TaxID=101571 RepID=UPI00075F4918|nr:hypothetical protein [Burkholderia ubonensis]KVT95625.1 hypothetical protein WK61_15660 [Burkholderia ubonensis]